MAGLSGNERTYVRFGDDHLSRLTADANAAKTSLHGNLKSNPDRSNCWITIVYMLAVCSLCATGIGCESTESCITVPATSSEKDRSVLIKAKAQLAQVPASGDLETRFNNIVKEEFDTISDEDKALFLFLTAIDCYLQRGAVGEQIALDMSQTVRARWGARKGFSGAPDTLQPIELREIREAEDGDAILRLFRSLGIQE